MAGELRDDVDTEMIIQVRANAREVLDNIDAVLL